MLFLLKGGNDLLNEYGFARRTYDEILTAKIEKAKELGIEAKSHMSGVDETEANKIKGALIKSY